MPFVGDNTGCIAFDVIVMFWWIPGILNMRCCWNFHSVLNMHWLSGCAVDAVEILILRYKDNSYPTTRNVHPSIELSPRRTGAELNRHQ